MEFLPKDYKEPKANSNYMKLQDGENRIRILSRPIIGWEDWHERKPVRYRMDEKPPKSFDPKKPLKHFWSFIVYNVNEHKIQIMHVTQSTIRRAIEALCRDSDWGAPFEYDIKITKSGEGIDTEYTVNPVPHKKTSKEVIELFKDLPINLEALFENEDPFDQNWKTYTPLATDENAAEPTLDKEEPTEKVANKDMIAEFYDTVLKKYKIEEVEKYLETWCNHWQQTPEEAIYCFINDIDKFEQKFANWLKTK